MSFPSDVIALHRQVARLKELTRGKGITSEALAAFVDQLPIPVEERARLRAMTPASYIGLAPALAKRV